MDQVRTIDAGAPPARFARGWHCLGLAERFREGGPHAVRAFGTKLVVFADSGGALHVLDGYCRHMGGDLTEGTVKGDAIVPRLALGRRRPVRVDSVRPAGAGGGADAVLAGAGAQRAVVRVARPPGAAA